MRKWFVFVIVLILVGSAIFFSKNRVSSPRFQGRPLIEWIREGYQTDGSLNYAGVSSPEAKKQADQAVRSAGTNAIPYYLSILQVPDENGIGEVISDWLTGQVSSSWGNRLAPWLNSQSIAKDNAACGFMILGPAAKSALPDLADMLNARTNFWPYRLAKIISSMGLDGIAPLTNCLAKPDPLYRLSAISALKAYTFKDTGFFTNSDAEMESAAKIIVPLMIPLLTDANEAIRLNAAFIIIRAPMRVNVSIAALAAAFPALPSGHRYGEERLLQELQTDLDTKNAVALLEEISADTNSAYSSQAAAILAHVHDDSLKMSKK